jgi:hypothetical protein
MSNEHRIGDEFKLAMLPNRKTTFRSAELVKIDAKNLLELDNTSTMWDQAKLERRIDWL